MPTRDGWTLAVAAVVLLAAAFVLGYPELAVFGFAAVAALLAAALWMLARTRPEARREIRPLRVTAGEEAAGALTVSNGTDRRCPPLTVRETIDGRMVRIPVPSLAARSSHRTGYALPPLARGVYAIGPLTVEHTDPLRLMAVTALQGGGCELYVHPAVDVVPPLPTGHGQPYDGPTTSLALQGGIAFHSLREYAHGDDWRQVHWRSSARTGQLMIRHNVEPDEPRMMIVLDTSAEAYEDDFLFEHAVRAVASLCVAALRAGFPLRLHTTAGDTMVAQADGHERMAILDLLAAVRREASDPGLTALPSFLPSHGTFSLGVVTGRAGPATLGMLPRVRPDSLTATLIQFSRAEAASLPGVLVLAARTSEEFVAAWNELTA